MTLEAVVFAQDSFGSYNAKDLYNVLEFGASNWANNDFDFGNLAQVVEKESSNSPPPALCEVVLHSSISNENNGATTISGDPPPTTTVPVRPKRRRSKSKKNKEEIENQRITHIAVERNRRKQMNDYLSVLRSLMPESYIQRGDQGSIVGGAIKFVKELEQRLHSVDGGGAVGSTSFFLKFFRFPQYTSHNSQFDIEVSMVDSHANLKIRSKRRPKQLLNLVSALHFLRLSLLHLNVITHHQIVLYTLTLKVEDDCTVHTVGEIATAVYEILGRIEDEAVPMN